MFIAVEPEQHGSPVEKFRSAFSGRGQDFVDKNNLIQQFINYCSGL